MNSRAFAMTVGGAVVDERRVAAGWYDVEPGRGCTPKGTQPYDGSWRGFTCSTKHRRLLGGGSP
jgi:hypothetical protein